MVQSGGKSVELAYMEKGKTLQVREEEGLSGCYGVFPSVFRVRCYRGIYEED